MSQVTLKHVHKVYEGGVHAVKDFNLDIKDKEFIVFVGPSGCGKSTTLRMIAGLEEITAGQLFIDNILVNDKESKDRDIAMVFQSYALYPHMTVYQNMAFGLKLRKFPSEDIDQRVKRAAEILEISDLLTRKPKALSGGQRQRVALGRAIVREPSVFLLDEPLSNLDAKLRVQMRTEITKLHNRLATTFIYVTHDQTEAMTMGTRIVVMKDGLIQQVDTPITLFENPTNLFVATFLGSPQMNILKAKLVLEGNKLVALLNGDEKKAIVFPDQKKRQLASKDYINKEVYLGIRPEHLELSEEGISAEIDVVEQLGDESLIYVKPKGIDKIIIIKAKASERYKHKQKIAIKFDASKIHLFDLENEASIIGFPHENRFQAKARNNTLVFGKNEWGLSSKLLDRAVQKTFEESMVVAFKPEDVLVKKADNCYKIHAKVDFIDEKSDYIACFAKVEGLSNYLVYRLKKEDKKVPTNEEAVTLYIPEDKVILYQNNERLLLKEKIYPNEAKCQIKLKGEKMIITLGNQKLILPKQENISEGEHTLRIKQEGVKVLFNKKIRKKYKFEKVRYPKNSLLKVSAYDEDKTGEKNALFVKINGFEQYVTLIVENNFTVYDMPVFKISLDLDAIEIL